MQAELQMSDINVPQKSNLDTWSPTSTLPDYAGTAWPSNREFKNADKKVWGKKHLAWCLSLSITRK